MSMMKDVLKKKGPSSGAFFIPSTPPPPVNMREPLDLERYSPLPWNEYFEQKHQVQVNETDSFCVYSVGDVANAPNLVVLLHGGGHSALTWSLCASHLKGEGVAAVAIDLRAHGSTHTIDEIDWSKERLARDVVDVLRHLSSSVFSREFESLGVILVGHSMGGAIAIEIATSSLLGANLKALAVIDIVEGSALDSLGHMKQVLLNRPPSFDAPATAIHWAVSNGILRNLDSARISIPDQLRLSPTHSGRWVWRTNLLQSEPYWRDWYDGMTGRFLSIPVPKLLMVAGTDRLDNEMIKAQMMGKFQFVLLPACGHTIQEDAPVKVAESIVTFKNRFRF